jgi:hypothetical protein
VNFSEVMMLCSTHATSLPLTNSVSGGMELRSAGTVPRVDDAVLEAVFLRRSHWVGMRTQSLATTVW